MNVAQAGYIGQFTQNNSADSLKDYMNQQQWAQLTETKKMPDGSKPIVVCRGLVTEAKDADDAQRIAESEAHSKSADAYILKPIRRVSPKREVVSTEL